jgi:hypothetical protein
MHWFEPSRLRAAFISTKSMYETLHHLPLTNNWRGFEAVDSESREAFEVSRLHAQNDP